MLLTLNNPRMIIRKQSEDARQYAYRVIKACIIELLLLPGQKINALEMASFLSISRTPVHDTFIKLSRENLVDIIPQRGAFVSKIDAGRIETAIWLHVHLGTSALQNIFIKNIKKQQINHLYNIIQQAEDCIYQRNLTQVPLLILDYYHQLYILAGEMELIWDSLQKSDVDLRRLLYLTARSRNMVEDFLRELTNLADALVKRDNDKACLIYNQHLSRMFLYLYQYTPNEIEL